VYELEPQEGLEYQDAVLEDQQPPASTRHTKASTQHVREHGTDAMEMLSRKRKGSVVKSLADETHHRIRQPRGALARATPVESDNEYDAALDRIAPMSLPFQSDGSVLEEVSKVPESLQQRRDDDVRMAGGKRGFDDAMDIVVAPSPSIGYRRPPSSALPKLASVGV
jgi:hypothetical protein